MPAYGLTQGGTTPVPQTTIVALSPVHGTPTGDIPAILDSGAAMSCLPETRIPEMGGDLVWTSKPCRGPVGEKEDRKVYRVHLRIGACGTVFENVRVVAIRRNYALIGRDILNKYKVVLDGPAKQWTHD